MRNILVYFLRIFELIFKNYVFTMKSGLEKGLKRRYGFGFKPKFHFVSKEDEFFMKYDFEGKTVFDVGAYVGLVTMFFARTVGQNGNVFSFEPNPRNYEELIYNVKLNGFSNITTMQLGLGEKHEKLKFAVDPTQPARGTFDTERKEKIIRNRRANTCEVEVYPLDELIKVKRLPKPDFIKVDVEGLEMDVLLGMSETIKKYSPVLFIEIHGSLKKEMILFLKNEGYSIFHIETEHYIDEEQIIHMNGEHIFCKQ